MNIYVAFSLFSLIVLLYWIISELFTMMFRLTGLPDERARFQVISLLTGCGYTTRESEMFLSSRSRRRLARVTMLFGYVFNVTIVTMFINVFLSFKLSQVGQYFLGILIPMSAAVVIVVCMRVPRVRAWGDRLMELLADRVAANNASNAVLLIDYIGQDSIAQVTLKSVPEGLRDLRLADSGLRQEQHILVMLVEKPGGKAEPATADTLFQDGDKLTVFGDYRTICRVFEAREHYGEEEEAS